MWNREVVLADSYWNMYYSILWAPFLCSFVNLCKFSCDTMDSVTFAVVWETSFSFSSSSLAPSWASCCKWHKQFVRDIFHIHFRRSVRHLIPFLVLEKKEEAWDLTGTPYVRRFCCKWKAKSWKEIMQVAAWSSALLVPIYFRLKKLRRV